MHAVLFVLWSLWAFSFPQLREDCFGDCRLEQKMSRHKAIISKSYIEHACQTGRKAEPEVRPDMCPAIFILISLLRMAADSFCRTAPWEPRWEPLLPSLQYSTSQSLEAGWHTGRIGSLVNEHIRLQTLSFTISLHGITLSLLPGNQTPRIPLSAASLLWYPGKSNEISHRGSRTAWKAEQSWFLFTLCIIILHKWIIILCLCTPACTYFKPTDKYMSSFQMSAQWLFAKCGNPWRPFTLHFLIRQISSCYGLLRSKNVSASLVSTIRDPYLLLVHLEMKRVKNNNNPNDAFRSEPQGENISHLSVDLPNNGLGWYTWFSRRLWFVGLTTLLCSQLIIDIILHSVAMATLRETFNFLSSIIIIYEAICCGKWIQAHLHDW